MTSTTGLLGIALAAATQRMQAGQQSASKIRAASPFKLGGRYNWRGQPERLVYIGYNWSGNGYWHQFEKVGEPGQVWCEVSNSDASMLEQTQP